MIPLRIDIWSDIACPWCYIGKRRLEAALQEAGEIEPVEVAWRAFELAPSAPRELDPGLSYAERLAKKYGQSPQQAQQMVDRLVAVAARDGLEFRFDRIRPGNTFDAHRLMHFAKLVGQQDLLAERLFRAYLTEGKSVSDSATLLEIATSAGFDEHAVTDLLASDLHADAVRSEEESAGKLGIQGVPFFVFDGRMAVSGAQPTEVFARVIERVRSERQNLAEFQEGAMCGPSGC